LFQCGVKSTRPSMNQGSSTNSHIPAWQFRNPLRTSFAREANLSGIESIPAEVADAPPGPQ